MFWLRRLLFHPNASLHFKCLFGEWLKLHRIQPLCSHPPLSNTPGSDESAHQQDWSWAWDLGTELSKLLSCTNARFKLKLQHLSVYNPWQLLTSVSSFLIGGQFCLQFLPTHTSTLLAEPGSPAVLGPSSAGYGGLGSTCSGAAQSRSRAWAAHLYLTLQHRFQPAWCHVQEQARGQWRPAHRQIPKQTLVQVLWAQSSAVSDHRETVKASLLKVLKTKKHYPGLGQSSASLGSLLRFPSSATTMRAESMRVTGVYRYRGEQVQI